MKKTFFTFCILAITIGFANAQGQVSNSAFTAKIIVLNLSISMKNISGQNNAFNQLNGMMNTQINSLNTSFNTTLVAFKNDTAKENAAKSKALAYLKAAAAETDQNKVLADNKSAQAEVENATADASAAQSQLQAMNQIATTINKEKKMYNSIQPLGSNIKANQNTIITNLNQFASTLQ